MIHLCRLKFPTIWLLFHCKKYNSTSPNLGKQLPFFGTEILHKTSLNQSYNNLRAAFLNLVWKKLIFNTFGKVLPRIGTCKASPKDWHKYADLLWKALLSTCSELPIIGTNLLEFLQFTYELWLFQTLVLQYISWVKMIKNMQQYMNKTTKIWEVLFLNFSLVKTSRS